MPAPFKRGTKLIYTCKNGHKVKVKYMKWWGFSRSALIVVKGPDGKEATVHVNDVKVDEEEGKI